jgi:hypothetical protein
MSVGGAHQFREEGHLTDVFVSELLKRASRCSGRRGLPPDPVERGAANVPTVVTQKAGDAFVVAASGLAHAEQQRGTPPVIRAH